MLYEVITGIRDALLFHAQTSQNEVGKRILWSGFQHFRGSELGGSGDDHALAPTTDSRGNIYVVGGTDSRDLPVTEGAYQTEFGGGDEDSYNFV